MNGISVETTSPIRIQAGLVELEGDLRVPDQAKGVVVFAHGSGSSRRSSRNLAVAQSLQDAGFATLLFDFLTKAEEEEDRHSGFASCDIDSMIGRLASATDWVGDQIVTRGLKIGYFGTGTGGAAALGAAAERSDVAAVVLRGGRPDLTPDSALAYLNTPTLLIVGGADASILAMNRRTMARMPGPVELEVIPGAGRLFEEPGTLDQVSTLTRRWFERRH